jgi:hypothetical protein
LDDKSFYTMLIFSIFTVTQQCISERKRGGRDWVYSTVQYTEEAWGEEEVTTST